jgi:mannose-1-phosphate guanylyltransferase
MESTRATKRVAIVMAGGSGERFWPLSRQRRPKQLLRLCSETETMLGEAVTRLAPLIPPEDIYVATSRHLVDPIRDAGVGVPGANVIAEPCKRNTSGCLAYAAAHLLAKHASADAEIASRDFQRQLAMAIVTADHTIGNPDAFRQTVKATLDAAEREHALAVIGIVPTRPETGYGYIQIPEGSIPVAGLSGDIEVHTVTAFHEKPSQERAEEFIATGRYFWNAGMFFWNVADLMAELEAARPQLAQAVIAMAGALRANDPEAVDRIFATLEDISIDYALMEHARKVLVARAAFAWDDVGAWPALDRTYPHDADGNVLVGNPAAVQCKNCIVYNDAAASGRDIAVAVVGAEDLVVVVAEDAVLVIPKDRAQDVKHAVAELRRRNANQL